MNRRENTGLGMHDNPHKTDEETGEEMWMVKEFMCEFCDADYDSRQVIATGKYNADELIEAFADEVLYLWRKLEEAGVKTY
jgi:hypothetical protein